MGVTTVQDEGAALLRRRKVNFKGAGVTCADNIGTAATDCTIPSGGGAPTDATYLTKTADATLSAEFSLGTLTTGLLLNTVAAATGTPSAYAGTSCTNQFPRSLDASGAATCASVVAADVTTDTLTTTQLAAALTFVDGDFLNLSAINASSTTEGVRLPQATVTTASTAAGQVAYDTDDGYLTIGTGSAADRIGLSIISSWCDNGLTADTYSAFGGNCNASSTTESNLNYVLPATISIYRMDCGVRAAPGGATSWAPTVRDDAVSTAATCTITGTAKTCTYTAAAGAPVVAAVGSLMTLFWDATGAVASSLDHGCAILVRVQ